MRTADQNQNGKRKPASDVIDLLLSDSDEDDKNAKRSKNDNVQTNGRTGMNKLSAYDKIQSSSTISKKKAMSKPRTKTTISQGLQAGLVLEEDIFAGVSNDDDDLSNRKAAPNVLFEDPEFGPMASSIHGVHRVSIADAAVSNGSVSNEKAEKWRPKCRCGLLSAVSYKDEDGRPYFSCGKRLAINKNAKNGRKCNFFQWAFRAELMPWYRFGSHNGHVLVRKDGFGAILDEPSSSSSSSLSRSSFLAQDLVQGKVGDCWFLSALAVVAERSDLVKRLFQRRPGQLQNEREDEQRGIIRVNLFLDGIWSPVTIDNFLPCFPGGDNSKKEEENLQKAIEASLLDHSTENNDARIIRNPYTKAKKQKNIQRHTEFPSPASGNDPHGLSKTNLRIMRATADFIEKDYRRRRLNGDCWRPAFLPKCRAAETSDLAYSKARRNQLWVPFLEKAYSKIHGSYQAISGGHVAEAFLDLTGAPTLQIVWHAGHAAAANNSSVYNDPKQLWADLKRWRRQKLPMGCGTDRSAGGLIGMHAYSILDVRELTNVDVDFFRDHIAAGTLGNVSGFTEYDGKLRLLRVRNPHGQGEWKGEFSDKSKTWEKLLASSGITLPRTMANDGTFWIGFDDFLLGFSNIDVVLAFEGNHAKSFVSNFPPKKSNHRCQRAFEVSLLDPQPGLETKDRVEVFVMGIQKSKRGARQGRADRKKSYKVSDLGILVGEYPLEESDSSENKPFSAIHGQMFGFKRNGHYKLVLDRCKCKRLVVMPISFGHPAATDEFRSFVVRFNADAPLMIRELESTPRMDRVLGTFLMAPKRSDHFSNTRQGVQTVLWRDSRYKVVQIDCLGNGGGTVFVYLCALKSLTMTTKSHAKESSKTLAIEATCRGMSCRVAEGLLDYETTAKGKKFQASWRKFTSKFVIETNSKPQSRVLMILYQSGQDTEMGSIDCKSNKNGDTPSKASTTLDKYWNAKKSPCVDMDYQESGVFNPITLDASSYQQCDKFENNFGGNHSIPNQEESIDDALEKAIALSRQDQVAVESVQAANGNTKSEDTILQEALELSCRETRSDTDAATSNVYHDLELADALRRSYQEAVSAAGGSGSSSTLQNKDSTMSEVLNLVDNEDKNTSSASAIDLTTSETFPNPSKKLSKKRSDTAVVLDLTTPVLEPKTPIATNKRVMKKTDGKEHDSVFVILDSSDEENDRSSSNGKNGKNGKNGSHSKEKDFISDSINTRMESSESSREKKRKLAADAALRRLKKLP